MQRVHIRIATAVSALLIGWSAAARAQAPAAHTHTSPHGGEIVEAAGHHVEFKADSTGAISVWLLDEHMKTVAPPAGANLTLLDPAGSQVTVPLEADTSGQRLVGRFDAQKLKRFQAIVSLPMGGTRQNVRFHYPAHH